jgi:hypothetical protein
MPARGGGGGAAEPGCSQARTWVWPRRARGCRGHGRLCGSTLQSLGLRARLLRTSCLPRDPPAAKPPLPTPLRHPPPSRLGPTPPKIKCRSPSRWCRLWMSSRRASSASWTTSQRARAPRSSRWEEDGRSQPLGREALLLCCGFALGREVGGLSWPPRAPQDGRLALAGFGSTHQSPSCLKPRTQRRPPSRPAPRRPRRSSTARCRACARPRSSGAPPAAACSQWSGSTASS